MDLRSATRSPLLYIYYIFQIFLFFALFFLFSFFPLFSFPRFLLFLSYLSVLLPIYCGISDTMNYIDAFFYKETAFCLSLNFLNIMLEIRLRFS